jgi:hypothetical protein
MFSCCGLCIEVISINKHQDEARILLELTWRIGIEDQQLRAVKFCNGAELSSTAVTTSVASLSPSGTVTSSPTA